jgi:hypothetical protein
VVTEIMTYGHKPEAAARDAGSTRRRFGLVPEKSGKPEGQRLTFPKPHRDPQLLQVLR